MSTSQQEYDLMKELYYSFFLQLECNNRKQFYFIVIIQTIDLVLKYSKNIKYRNNNEFQHIFYTMKLQCNNKFHLSPRPSTDWFYRCTYYKAVYAHYLPTKLIKQIIQEQLFSHKSNSSFTAECHWHYLDIGLKIQIYTNVLTLE